jgi:DNA-binding NarL/FixJ family response regulator
MAQLPKGQIFMIRILVVDDHPVVRHGLVAMLGYEPDIEVVGDAADGEEAVEAILELQPDVVLLDLRLPKLSGIEVMRQVRLQWPQTIPLPIRFLVLTTYDTDQYIAQALAAGAQGYLLKDATPDELAQAVRSLMRGGAQLSPEVAARVLERMNGDELSARELQVLQLLVSGDTNKAIAKQLHLSQNTIKTHLRHIFSKLDVQSRAEAVAVGLQRGLVSLTHR